MPILQAMPEFHLSRSSITAVGAGLTMIMTAAESFAEPRKIGVLLIILFVSFFAVSFPSLSKQISFLRIPGIVFFIGKHFGTGVILATAFIHLLDDAFRSLQDPKVEEKYGGIKKWTGSIILGSLLSIFLVEYISTSYVQRLQEKSSAPPTPSSSRPNSPSPYSYRSRSIRNISRSRSRSRTRPGTAAQKFLPRVEPNPRSIPELSAPPNISFVRAPSAPVLPVRTHSVTYPHPPHHAQLPHHHHTHAPTIPASAIVGLPIEVLASSPRICRLALAHDHVHGHHHHLREGHPANEMQHDELSGEEDERLEHSPEHEHEHEHEHYHPIIGRRRQVVGLLVLQLGIMIHSLVIGLTLSVTTGSDFTSLTTAIVFHQLFEGLSLGIRIAALPPIRKKSRNNEPKRAHGSVNTVLDYPSQSTTVVSGRSNDGFAEASPSSSTQHGDTSLPHSHGTINADPSSTPHTTTPMSPKLSRMGAFSCRRWMWKIKDFEWLKPTLTFLFGVTTPFGMVLGMAVWNNRASGDSGDEGSMLLIQGVMSAISAGLLIYAATVEMLAADFVFGDVEGNHHHHHAHAHANSTDDFHGREHGHHMDEESFTDGNGGNPGPSVDKDGKKKQPTAVPKQILAVLSLFAGAGTMVLVGLGE